MKKFLTGLGIVSTICITFALTSTQLKDNLNQIYDKYSTQLATTYKNYLNKLQNTEKQFNTGDYKILASLTGIDFSTIKINFKNLYNQTLSDLTTQKYKIVADIETTDTNFKNWLISTWDYNNKLEEIQTSITNYENIAKNKTNSFENTLSGDYHNFINSIDNKLNYYKNDIQKYKDFENKLNDTLKQYQELEDNYNKLQKIIWISKKVFDQKSDDLKNYINQYYSGLLEKEFNKYLEQEPNMSYFASWFALKKKILLGYVNGQFSQTIQNIIKSYYPDIDMDSLSKELNQFKQKNISEIVKNYNILIANLNSLEKTIQDYQSKVNEKLEKFPKQDSESILKVLEKDLITFMNESTKLIQEDINETLQWWLTFINTRKTIEKPLIEKVTQIYTQAFWTGNLDILQQALNTIKSYQQVIILPENKSILENYIKSLNQKIQEVKLQEIISKLENIQNQLDIIPIGNKEKLETLKQEFNKIKSQLTNIDSEKIKNLIKNINLKIQLKENLNKLYDHQAISFYYQYGDLSDTVANLLKKYYDKYKKEGKEDLFMEKIDKALEKIQLLEQSLNNDIRSYYIIMIHNGILKFKAELQS